MKLHPLLIAITLCAAPAAAQNIDAVLADIARNNLQLQAVDKQRTAEKIELKTQNNLGRTAVSYSPFFANGVQGIASSELVVSQDFDFPTLYAQRHKLIREQSGVLDKDFEALQRDVLHQARLLCLEIIYQQKLIRVLESRKSSMTELAALYEKKLAESSTTVLEVNRVKMENMQLATTIEQCRAAIATATTALRALNGEKEISLTEFEYPTAPQLPDAETLVAQYLANDRALQSSALKTDVISRQVRISRQGLLPSLSVGYRRNTALEEQSHGFLVGAAVPLFSNRNKTRAAKAQLEAAEAEVTHLRTHTEAEVRKQVQELASTLKAMQAYDNALMSQSLVALKKATEQGQLSAIDYCRETRDISTHLADYLALEYRYQTLLAELTKNN